MNHLDHYSILAELFKYPTEQLIDCRDKWKRIILDYSPALLSDLEPFISHLENSSLQYQQEYYVSTFDVHALCCLDIGHVLFGQDYRRGQFLAMLKMEHNKAGNDCGTELPDNLPVLLRLLPKIADPNFAEELSYSLIIPAIRKIISGFRSADNHYKAILRIVAAIMEKDFQCSQYEQFQFEMK